MSGGRMCKCPLFDPFGNITFEEYVDLKEKWNEERKEEKK